MVAAVWDSTVGREAHSSTGPQIAALSAALVVLLGVGFGGLVPALAIATVLVVGCSAAHAPGKPLLPGHAAALSIVHLLAVVPFLA